MIVLTPETVLSVAVGTFVVADGYVELDETKTYIEAQVTIPLDDDEDVAALVAWINPRVEQYATLTHNGREFTRLLIRERYIDHEGRTLTISFASGEALLGDYVRLEDYLYPGNNALTVRQLVQLVLGTVYTHSPIVPIISGASTPDAPIEPDDEEGGFFAWPGGVSAWEFLLSFTAPAGLRLFCDERGVWRLVDTSYVHPGAITVTPSNTRSAQDTLSRDSDQWASGVVVRYRWTKSSTGEPRERIDKAGHSSSASQGVGRVRVIDVAAKWRRNGAAAAVLRRLRGQGLIQSATVAGDITATPGMECRFVLPYDDEQIGRLQRVRFELRDGMMQLAARELTEAGPASWIYLPSGESWTDSPVGQTWIGELV